MLGRGIIIMTHINGTCNVWGIGGRCETLEESLSIGLQYMLWRALDASRCYQSYNWALIGDTAGSVSKSVYPITCVAESLSVCVILFI